MLVIKLINIGMFELHNKLDIITLAIKLSVVKHLITPFLAELVI